MLKVPDGVFERAANKCYANACTLTLCVNDDNFIYKCVMLNIIVRVKSLLIKILVKHTITLYWGKRMLTICYNDIKIYDTLN